MTQTPQHPAEPTEDLDEQRSRARPLDRYTFAAVADKVGVSARDLRYVLDHDLLPTKFLAREESLHQGRGVTRMLSKAGAFAVALPAVMLRLGLRREGVRRIMEALLSWATSQTQRLNRTSDLGAFLLFLMASAVRLEVADGKALRMEVDQQLLPTQAGHLAPHALPWTDLETKQAMPEGFRPLMSVRLDLGVLIDRLR